MRVNEEIIRKIEIFQLPVKLKQPFIISLGAFHYAENVIVKISTHNGITGFGECSPFMSIHGESMETCFVVAGYLAKGLIGKNALDIEACIDLMDKTIYGNSSIKSAFDIALHDIASQQALQPLYAFLGGKNDKDLKTDYTVSIGDAGKMAEDAVKIKEKNFSFIKVKLGDSKEKDVERIRKIRDKIGMKIPLRIDANQGWDKSTAIEILKELANDNVEFCEEPIPRWDFAELPEIKKQSPIPIMADESCCNHHDARRLIAIEACHAFNIKLWKSSGIFSAQKIVRLAEQSGIKLQVGGFLESRLGFTASAHLALTSSAVSYTDFDTPLMFEDDPVNGGITYHHGGVIKMPDKPGLGATVDEKYLSNLVSVIIR